MPDEGGQAQHLSGEARHESAMNSNTLARREPVNAHALRFVDEEAEGFRERPRVDFVNRRLDALVTTSVATSAASNAKTE